MKYKLIIFDFDGTLADYLPFIKPIYNEVADSLKLKKMVDINIFRNMTTKQFIKDQKIPFFRIPYLLRQGREIQLKYMDKMKLRGNMKEVLEKIHSECKIGILSSNSKKVIYSFLGRHKMESMFDFVQSYGKLYAKFIPLTKIMLEKGLKPSEVLYVGDEVRDIQATKQIHMDIATVTWGFDSEELLKKHDPAYIINKPDELLDII